ncbi:MAG: hypothetical protein MUC87_06810 [Bacteroidia bacterium]|jgi:hypothetical protein|nr:hypothetical protein [Bacteroidia bacterium]
MKRIYIFIVLPLFIFFMHHEKLKAQPAFPAQQLLYAIESPDSVMMHNGYIRSCLEGMTYRDQQTLPLFSKLTCLNDLKDIIDLESKIYSFARFFDPNNSAAFQHSPARMKRDSLLAGLLTTNDAFLLVKIRRNESGNYIYNFSYTEDRLNNVDVNPELQIDSYDAILANPVRDIEKLRIALYNVCRKANRSPQHSIISNAVLTRNALWLAAGDTLKISALINDDDSEYFRYEWTVKSARKQIACDTGKSIQLLRLNDTGLYHIQLRISDGITSSATETMRVTVVFRPQISRIIPIDRFIPTPLNMYYQPHFTMNEYKVVRQKSQRMYMQNFPADKPNFTFFDEKNQNAANDTVFQNQFSVKARKEYYEIVYRQREKEAGFYRFAVTVTEHGLTSAPGTFTFQFRKACKAYFQAGVSSVHYNTGPGPKKVYVIHPGIGFFVHPKVHFDYQLEFAGLDNTHPLFGQNQVLRYPGHRFTVSHVIPLRKADEVLWTIDMTLVTFRYPQLSENREAALGFGSTMRLLYIKSVGGIFMRGAYVLLRPKSGSIIPSGAFVFTTGASLQPVRKQNPKRK